MPNHDRDVEKFERKQYCIVAVVFEPYQELAAGENTQ